MRIQIEILRITDRRGHAAQVGGDGLHHNTRNKPLVLSGHVQNFNCKGDEGDQCDIVRDQHT